MIRNLFHKEGTTDLRKLIADAQERAAKGETVVLHMHECDPPKAGHLFGCWLPDVESARQSEAKYAKPLHRVFEPVGVSA